MVALTFGVAFDTRECMDIHIAMPYGKVSVSGPNG